MKPQNEIILAEFDKSATEVVRIVRHKLNRHDLISIKVYSCTGTNSEKGISMHLPLWEEHVISAILRGLQIDFRKPKRKSTHHKVRGSTYETKAGPGKETTDESKSTESMPIMAS